MATTDENEMMVCGVCQGEGQVLIGVDLLEASPDQCDTCGGRGFVPRPAPKADDPDPVLIPSLPEPWEGLVRTALDTAGRAEIAEWTADFPKIARARHAASRAERALRLALNDLLQQVNG